MSTPRPTECSTCGASIAFAYNPADTGSHDLTPRELDVLRLAGKGLTRAEIGSQLVISHHTVRNHMVRVGAKLGARNRTHAVVIALRAGVIRLEDISS